MGRWANDTFQARIMTRHARQPTRIISWILRATLRIHEVAPHFRHVGNEPQRGEEATRNIYVLGKYNQWKLILSLKRTLGQLGERYFGLMRRAEGIRNYWRMLSLWDSEFCFVYAWFFLSVSLPLCVSFPLDFRICCFNSSLAQIHILSTLSFTHGLRAWSFPALCLWQELPPGCPTSLTRSHSNLPSSPSPAPCFLSSLPTQSLESWM